MFSSETKGFELQLENFKLHGLITKYTRLTTTSDLSEYYENLTDDKLYHVPLEEAEIKSIKNLCKFPIREIDFSSTGNLEILEPKDIIHLDVTRFKNLDTIYLLLNTCKNIKTVKFHIINSSRTNDLLMVSEIIRSLSECETLYFDKNNINDSVGIYLSKCVNLRTLSLSWTYITDLTVKSLSECRFLTDINLSYNKNITDRSVEYLSKCEKLHTVNLCDTNITDMCWYYLSNLVDLHTVNLSLTKITDTTVGFLSNRKNLYNLGLRQTKITDTAMSFLTKCENLQIINISMNKLTDTTSKHLSKVKNIKFIDISYNDLTDLSCEYLSKCESLHSISLISCNITDAGVQKLYKCENILR